MDKLLILIIFTITNLSAAIASSTNYTSNIVARVNNRAITSYEFDSRKKMLVKLNNIQSLDAKTIKELNRFAMDTLINEQVIFQYNENDNRGNASISEEEIDAAIASIEQRNNLPSKYLTKSFENEGAASSFRSQIKSELIKMQIFSNLSRSIAVSSKEIDAIVLTSDVAHIHVSAQTYTSRAKDQKSFSSMNNLRKQIKNCDKLKDSSYNKFADHLYIDSDLNSLDLQSQTIVKDLDMLQTSKVFEAPEGFKVVTVCNKIFNKINPEESSQITNYLTNKKISQKAQKFFTELRKKAYIKTMIDQ